MQTLEDLLANPVRLPLGLSPSTGLPQFLTGRPKLVVPGSGHLLLPVDRRGMEPRRVTHASVSALSGDQLESAQAMLVAQPGLCFSMADPSGGELIEIGLDPAKFRSERARSIGAAICVLPPEHGPVYGVARIVAIENGIRMGSTAIGHVTEHWLTTLDDAEDSIISMLRSAQESLTVGPEPRRPGWLRLVVLVGGHPRETSLPADWQRRLALIAGLRKIELRFMPNPDSARGKVIQDLRSNPPDGLLVWGDWVASPAAYSTPFLAANPKGWSEVLGSEQGSGSFEDAVIELALHLRERYPISSQAESEATLSDKLGSTWREAAQAILGLRSDAFCLSDHAISKLDSNPYPYPARMLEFVEKLASLAAEFHAADGVLGRRLSDHAIESYGIEIALHDASLDIREFEYQGVKHAAEAHVKVDDAKSADKCGRIYFAIDARESRFIVDHIGLHDYGR